MYLTWGREPRWSASPAVPPIQRSLVSNDGAFLYLKFKLVIGTVLMYLIRGRESRWNASPAVPPTQRSLVRNDGAFLYLKFKQFLELY